MNDQEFVRALHKYREEVVWHPLEFRPALERLMDEQHCLEMNKSFYRTAKWERIKAVESLGSSLPAKRGVYMFVWKSCLAFPFESSEEHLRWVLYVGKAGKENGDHDTLRNRYLKDYRQFVGGDVNLLWNRTAPSTRDERLARYLTLRPLEYWFVVLDEPEDISILEKKLIRMLSPPLNRQHVGPKLTPGNPVPAF